MPFGPGTCLGSYEVTAKIGASRHTHVFPVFFMVNDNVHGC